MSAGARAAQAQFSGLVLLAGELQWREGKAVLVRADIDWETVRTLRVPVALALRVAPGTAGKLTAGELAHTARVVLEEARVHGVAPAEFQLDFDCAQKSLPAYAGWLRAVRPAVAPARLVITALPAWLAEPAFPALLREAEGYVLQVHSVPVHAAERGAWLCDPAQARRWIAQASRLGRPFSIALPTYRCVAGYAPAGQLLSVAMDSVQPAWPPGTRTLTFAADAAAIAGLVHELQQAHPPELRELLWYRVPVPTDERNWRWPTLAAVMGGRAPQRRYEVASTGTTLVDLALRNTGEDETPFAGSITVTGAEGPPLAAEALAGWSVRQAAGRTIFTAEAALAGLPPGEGRAIGWLRYARAPLLHYKLVAKP